MTSPLATRPATCEQNPVINFRTGPAKILVVITHGAQSRLVKKPKDQDPGREALT